MTLLSSVITAKPVHLYMATSSLSHTGNTYQVSCRLSRGCTFASCNASSRCEGVAGLRVQATSPGISAPP